MGDAVEAGELDPCPSIQFRCWNLSAALSVLLPQEGDPSGHALVLERAHPVDHCRVASRVMAALRADDHPLDASARRGSDPPARASARSTGTAPAPAWPAASGCRGRPPPGSRRWRRARRSGQPSPQSAGSIAFTLPMRFVSSSQSRCGVRSMSAKNLARQAGRTRCRTGRTRSGTRAGAGPRPWPCRSIAAASPSARRCRSAAARPAPSSRPCAASGSCPRRSSGRSRG
jgi:hypothetical protein